MPTNNPNNQTNYVRFSFRKAARADTFVAGLRLDFNVSEDEETIVMSEDRKSVRVSLGQGDYDVLTDYAKRHGGHPLKR